MGRVTDYIHDQLRGGPVHMTLIDPEKSPGEKAGLLARGAVRLGSHAIMLGGSTGISPKAMAAAARAVKRMVEVPTIIFPEGPASLSGEADAVYFMSMLNSRNIDLVIRAHARAAPVVKRMGLEPISLGYIVIAPGMRVGEVGRADLVPRKASSLAVGYALAAEYLGMQFVYLEAGSGAPAPVPPSMIRAVRAELSIPLIVGGGIRNAADAGLTLAAGAQILVTGTVMEEKGLGEAFRGILNEVRAARGG